MFDPKIRENVLPFLCQNPACGVSYDIEGLKGVLRLWGLIYADCGDFIYQGITCRKCKQTTLRPVPRTNPIVDLRDFIIVPNINPAANTWEQFIQRERAKEDHDLLKFKCIPAWDDETISYADMINIYPSTSHDLYTSPGIPYVMMIPGDVERKLDQENETGQIQLRRLYPNIPKFRNLLICLSPQKVTEVGIFEEETETSSSEAVRGRESEEKSAAWIGLLEEAAGRPLLECASRHLALLGYAGFDEDALTSTITRHLRQLYPGFADHIRNLSTNVGFEARIWGSLKRLLERIIYPVCTDIAFADKKRGLSGWTDHIEKQKALFVDAPVGVGRTYSIVEALGEHQDLSAVIFLPTEKLCQEIVTRLRTKIALKRGLRYWDQFEYEKGFDCGLKREFLQEEVYYVDGINENECPHYAEIAEDCGRNLIPSKKICDHCKKRAKCRFLSHWEKAPLSRIVVATHQRYDQFCQLSNLHKWFKYGLQRKNEALLRDIVILDEDFVLSHCYRPMAFNPPELKAYFDKVTQFLSANQDTDHIIDKIHSLRKHIGECEQTAITPPIDPAFKFPREIEERWQRFVDSQAASIPLAFFDSAMVAGSLLEWVENAIRLGIVVENGRGLRKGLGKAYLPNPKVYDLSKLPPHVFFDETGLENGFLQNKFKNVDFKRLSIEVRPATQLRVWQNVNTDLPSKWMLQNEPRVKEFVGDLLKEAGTDHTYLFITSETIKNAFLADFLGEECPGLAFFLEDYVNLRSMDYATECNIAVVLGSFIPRDAVEVAMSLPFIRDKLPENRLTTTQPHLWTWRKSAGQRVYEDDYTVVAEISRSLRFSSHRCAIARTRYLFDDVDFYIVSKDPISHYAPFLPQAETLQYRSDIFPPKLQRSDSKFDQIKEAVFDWLSEHDSATVTGIHRQTGIRRGTVADHLKELEDAGLLAREGKRYRLPTSVFDRKRSRRID